MQKGVSVEVSFISVMQFKKNYLKCFFFFLHFSLTFNFLFLKRRKNVFMDLKSYPRPKIHLQRNTKCLWVACKCNEVKADDYEFNYCIQCRNMNWWVNSTFHAKSVDSLDFKSAYTVKYLCYGRICCNLINISLFFSQ